MQASLAIHNGNLMIRRFTDAEYQVELQEMVVWTKSIAASGKLIATEPLEATGRYVTKKKVLSDGPFIEAKEGVAGFYIILANNMDEAVAVAESCPYVKREQAVIEVRPVLAFEKKSERNGYTANYFEFIIQR